MVSLDNVVEVFHLSVAGVGGAFALFLQLANGFTEKPLGGFRVAGLGQVKIEGVPVAVNGAIQIRPFALDLDVGLIHAPRPGQFGSGKFVH